MHETTLEIRTPDGTMETFISSPERDTHHPVVVLYMDALGIREELRDMARRVAAQGYYTMLPNLYYRAGGPSFDASGLPHRVDPRVHELNHGTTHPMVLSDTMALLDFVGDDAAAGNGTLGCIGFCMGGRHAYAAAGVFAERVGAAASIHGGFLITDQSDSPHLRTEHIRAEMYFGFADQDPVAPRAHMDVIAGLLAEHGVRGEVELHEGALHGFMFPERYCYHEQAAERVWEHWFAMLRRKLG